MKNSILPNVFKCKTLTDITRQGWLTPPVTGRRLLISAAVVAVHIAETRTSSWAQSTWVTTGIVRANKLVLGVMSWIGIASTRRKQGKRRNEFWPVFVLCANERVDALTKDNLKYYIISYYIRVAGVAQARKRRLTKSLDSDENFKLRYFVAN